MKMKAFDEEEPYEERKKWEILRKIFIKFFISVNIIFYA